VRDRKRAAAFRSSSLQGFIYGGAQPTGIQFIAAPDA